MWSNLFTLKTIFVFTLNLLAAECRRYHAHDRIGIVANTVGPFNNPTETYPVCIVDFYMLT